MPYVDDLVSNQEMVPEVSTGNIATVSVLEEEVASKLFPGLTLPRSENLAFVEFVFCNSLPKKNERGRAFTPRVLANSFASLNDQLIDYEHLLDANNLRSYDGERIIGHVKATRFSMPQAIETASAKEIASLTEPIPAFGLGALFLRARGVERIVKSKSGWKTSMECGHRWSDACFMYENEFIPIKDADIAMRNCVGPSSVKRYRDRDLTICLGGESGSVDFWGVALTQNPADDSADILSITSGRGPELASKKIFYMPMTGFSETALEIANKSVDKKLEEYASISIIGETEPDEKDGHVHQILSNMTVLPAQGHSHYGSSFVITRGSNPRLTGVTETHTEYPAVSTGNPHEHRHLIDIPLKGKYQGNGSEDDDPSEMASIIKEEHMNELEKLLKRLSDLASELASCSDEQRKQKETELASLRSQISDLNSQEEIKKSNESYLKAKIDAGEVILKEVADAEKEEAVKEVRAEVEENARRDKIKADRLLKCTEAGIDLDVEFEGIKTEAGTPMKMRDRIDLIGTDEAGERQFNMDFSVWASSPSLLKKKEEQEQLQEVASNGKRVVKSLVGGMSSEQANDGKNADEGNTKTPPIPAHLQGRRAFKK